MILIMIGFDQFLRWSSISQLTFSPSKVTFGLMFRDKLLLQLPNKLAFNSDFLINR